LRKFYLSIEEISQKAIEKASVLSNDSRVLKATQKILKVIPVIPLIKNRSSKRIFKGGG